MKKRIVALLLCCVMLLTLSPSLIATATAEDETAPAQTEVTVSPAKADLPRNKKVTLTAQAKDAKSYQWQIMAEDDLWVDISGETESTIQVSYAMVASLLNGSKAQLRCKTDLGTTDPATVTVTEAQAVAAAPAKAAPKVGTVMKEAEAINNAVVQDGAGDVVNDETVTPGETIGDERDTYTIVINYVFADGKQAANPWTATVAKGSSYAQDVTSPTVLGYAPDQETVSVNVENAQADTTYKVTYKPAEVEFTVKHYQQNVSNDQYTLVDTEPKRGYTKSAVGGNLAKTTYEGFYSLLYDTTPEIAADGSTVVEIYYDRYYYLMNFDLDGGYGVEPIYARYGSKIDVDDSALKKAGYTFDKWDPELPETMPVDGGTYKVVWKVNDTAKVTVVIWGENANDEDYSYIKSSEIQVKPGTTLTKDDLTHILICDKEEHDHAAAGCTLSCDHVHTLVCYGLRSNASSCSPNDKTAWWCDSKPETYFAQLGLEDGCLYYDDENAALDSRDNYYLRLNGKYYKLSERQFNQLKGEQVGKTSDNTDGNPDFYYKYKVNTSGMTCTHTHTDSCYICGKAQHTHDASCYTSPLDMDGTLWRLVSSDTVTVAANGTSIINVYYDRTEFTLTFKVGKSTVKEITGKWGSDIKDQFPIVGTNGTKYNGYWWQVPSGSITYDKGKYLLSIDMMPKENITFSGTYKGTKAKLYYYVEKLPGDSSASTDKSLDQISFKLYKPVVYSVQEGTLTEKEEFYEIPGFEKYKSDPSFTNGNPRPQKNNYFYYRRRSFELKFYNYNKELSETRTVLYEDLINTHTFAPAYPDDLEANAYTFEGWYTDQFFKNKVDDSARMPANDVMLYAKWTPKTHTVKTYLTKDVLDKGGNPLNTWEAVPHGTAVENPPAAPTHDPYKFVGWFYKDNGVEKAFDFSMPVNKDLDLYAKWNANSLVTYTIKYAVKNEDGTLTYIADETTGSALAATTKTFEAKTGTQLNEGYQKGYFPETGSHSITMDINGNNEFTFIYVPKARVNYTVRYLEKGTNAVLHEEKTAETSDAVITEKFVAIPGYAPDAYQKRLVLGIDETQNVITFWYVKDDEHAPVQVIHWIQNIVGDGYTEYQSSTDLNAKLGEEQTSTALTIPGFTYAKGTAVVGTTTEEFTAPGTPKAVLTADGLVLNLYYDRIEYPYEFRFLEQGTDKELADPVTGNARYQAQVTQGAKTIPGYTLVSAENQAINIAIEDPATVASRNVRTFYYTEQTVDIKYEVVGPTADCGTVTPASETVKVITGTPTGSVAAKANDNFRFVGWFKDKDCTQPVDGNWVDANNKLTPGKTVKYGDKDGYAAATYYAKFEYNVTDLTITKTYADGAPKDPNQSAVFVVTGGDLGTDGLTVVLNKGNEYSVTIKGLKVGTTYTVTEKTWTWRYTTDPTSPNSRSIQLVDGEGDNTITFTNTLTKNKWLTGGAWCDNSWATRTSKESKSTNYSGK